MAISRRSMLLGGAAAALAIPSAMHLSWNAKSFVQDGYSPEPPPAPPGRSNWSNWSGSQRATPQSIAVARNESDVVALVKNSPTPIRAVGAGHSFTGLVPSEGTILDISPMAGLIHSEQNGRRVTFGAGTHLQQAVRELEALGMAFPNMPDIDTQTLGGMFSTATHGTGLTLPAMHSRITGFSLMTASGEKLEVTAQNNPDLFAAGKVSLGTLGIMTSYTIEPVEHFALRRKVWIEAVDEILPRIMTLVQQHRNFEMFYFPGTGRVAALTHDLHTGPVSGRPPSGDEDILAGLRSLRDKFGWSPRLRRLIAGHELPDQVLEDSSDQSWKLLSTSRPTKFNEMEYHVPLANGLDALREVIAAADQNHALFIPIEIRTIAPDDAWLSPFQGGPRMSIALHCKVDEDFGILFDLFEPIFLAHGGRPHWGKHNSLNAAQLSQLYPRFGDFQALRRRLDPQGKFLSPHMAAMMGEA